MAELPENDRIAGPFIATGGQTDFPADFPLIDASALRFRRERDGVVTVLDGAALSAVNLVDDGFTCRLAVGAQAGDRCFVYSTLAPKRLRQHVANGVVRSATLEGDAVDAMALHQERARNEALTLTVPPGETGPELPRQADRDGKLPLFVAGGISTLGNGLGETGVMTLSRSGTPVLMRTAALIGRASDDFDGGLDGEPDGDSFDGGFDGVS